MMLSFVLAEDVMQHLADSGKAFPSSVSDSRQPKHSTVADSEGNTAIAAITNDNTKIIRSLTSASFTLANNHLSSTNDNNNSSGRIQFLRIGNSIDRTNTVEDNCGNAFDGTANTISMISNNNNNINNINSSNNSSVLEAGGSSRDSCNRNRVRINIGDGGNCSVGGVRFSVVGGGVLERVPTSSPLNLLMGEEGLGLAAPSFIGPGDEEEGEEADNEEECVQQAFPTDLSMRDKNS